MSTTLFDDETAAPAEPVPNPPDFYNLYAREAFGAPAGWRWASLNCADDVAPDGFLKVEGAVMPERKGGGVNWRKRTRGTESTHFIDLRAFGQWKESKALAAGVCLPCWGAGRESVGFNVKTGPVLRECRRCGGTGKPAAAHAAIGRESAEQK